MLIPPSFTLLLVLLPLLPTPLLAITITQTITAPAPASTNSTSYTSDPDFQNAILNSTNFYRNEHNASALTWNKSLADYGGKYAEKCIWAHSHGPSGENLAEGYDNVTAAVDAWGNERAEYDFQDPGFSEATGHFTQLVWKNTTATGCGRADCNGTNGIVGWLVVCEYWPPGNVGGEYKEEVQGQVKGGVGRRGCEGWVWAGVGLVGLMVGL